MADGIDSYFYSSDNDDGDAATTMTFLTQEQQQQQEDDVVPNGYLTSLIATNNRQMTETSTSTTIVSSALSASSLVHNKRRCSPRIAAAAASANTAVESPPPNSRKRPAVATTVMSPTEQQRQTSPCRDSQGRQQRPSSFFRETSFQAAAAAAAAAAATDIAEKDEEEEEIHRREYDYNDDERKPAPSNGRLSIMVGENGTALTKDEDTDESSSSTNSFSSDSFDDDESMSSNTNHHVAENNCTTDVVTNLTLTEKRARNVRRNNNVLASLGLAHGIITHTASKKQHSTSANRYPDTDGNGNRKPRGMLLSGQLHPPGLCPDDGLDLNETSSSSSSSTLRLLLLEQQYPHREAQIRKLRAWLSAVLAVPAPASNNHTANNCSRSSSTSPFVPPPIFITGPVGCGKTAVVRDVVQSLATHNNNNHYKALLEQEPATKLIHAYIDCATLDSSDIEELVGNAYTQLKEQMRRHKKNTSHVGAAASGERCLSTAVMNIGSTRSQPHLLAQEVSPAQRPKNQTQPSTASSSKRKSRRVTFPSTDDGHTMVVEHEDVSERRMTHTGRRLSARNNDKRAAQLAAERKQVQLAKHDDIAKGQQQAHNTAPTAVWMFGRSLERLLLSSASCIAVVIVVDHAERLLSLRSNTKTTTGGGDRVNFLAQLLLLPRTLGLNVTIIAITKSVMLEHCTLNNLTSQGTIAGHINPIRLHFPAYRGKITIQSILLNKRMKRLIMGEGCDDACVSYEFLLAVYRSFLETLIQSLYDLTTDLKEYIRLGRALWPRYIAPISSLAATNKVLESIQKANVNKGNNSTHTSPGDAAFIQREILSLLDQKIFPQIRHTLEHGTGALAFDSPAVVVVACRHTSTTTRTKLKQPPLHNVPILAKYLLLATYLCQANRPEKDKQLFSIQTNGKKKRRNNANNGNTLTGEEVAFGSSGTQDQQLNSLRRQAFPVERLYSLYVSLISLNPNEDLSSQFGDDGDYHQDEMLRSLGNVPFQETVAYLRDIGILHDYPKRSVSENVRLSQRNFWSSLTRDEAQAVAKSVGFPLDRYIL